MSIRDDLKVIYSGPLSDKARVVTADGRSVEISGYVSTKTYDRDIDARYRAKTQVLSFHCLSEAAADFDVGDMFFISKIARKIVSISDNLDGTVILELSEEVIARRGREGKEGGGSSGSDDDSSRFG